MEPPAWREILSDPRVRTFLTKAWQASSPDTEQAHEEGGFIVMDEHGELQEIRWEQGESRRIELPPHRGCKIEEQDIVASFHTHPHSTAGYDQRPSDTDIRSIKRDRHLKGLNYIGEFVISLHEIFLIEPQGYVSILGNTTQLLGWSEAT